MKQILKDLGIQVREATSIMCDNTSCINISKTSMMHSITKHISIRYHFFKERGVEEEVKLDFVPTIEQVVNISTKPLPKF